MTCVTNGNTNGPCPNLSFGTSNRITTSGYSYDAAGNLTSDGTNSYTWDAENHLSQIVSGSTTENLTYNAYGWRVTNSIGSVSYLLDPGGQLLGARWSGGGQNSFMWLGSRLMAGYTSGAHFAHANVLGSETHMTDYAGNDAQAILYYPWGQVWSNPGGNSLLQEFASLTLYDTVNNGYVPPFRYYVSNQGRWLTPDPLAGDITNPQSLNRYAYVGNSPCSSTDPLGLTACNFNISLKNQANLSGEDVTLIQAQIQALFQASSQGQPNSVGVNFEFSGAAANTLTFNNSGRQGGPGGVPGTVYANLISESAFGPYYSRALGVEATHELGHSLGGFGDLPFEPQAPNLMSVDSNPAWKVPSQNPLYSPNFPAGLLFTPQQVKALFSKCSKDVGSGKAPFVGAGAGGAGSFFYPQGTPVAIWSGPFVEGGYDYATIYWAGPIGTWIPAQRK